MNTQLNYFYRDGCDYKVYNTCVIEGEMTDALFERIRASLYDGEYFTPDLVGLPGQTMVDLGYTFDPEIDNNLFEFCGEAFVLTNKAADVHCKVKDLVNKFVQHKGKWLTENI